MVRIVEIRCRINPTTNSHFYPKMWIPLDEGRARVHTHEQVWRHGKDYLVNYWIISRIITSSKSLGEQDSHNLCSHTDRRSQWIMLPQIEQLGTSNIHINIYTHICIYRHLKKWVIVKGTWGNRTSSVWNFILLYIMELYS